ncbi:hypothetical protein Rhe02_73390 [Rhizocola hellebori]|uniref:Uncharacterized protein n=1 Tax=Rhizocola hellebori TaxID=1392758 RepID=A0A8J3QFU8_9ACTN|nr:hypothetical protein [Rhizocola hellebori]GIH09272.1 hypothetical protein Rhe02_73390 [Rhizocola hellebori]
MGFGYKTSWLAVPGRSAEDVADALKLHDREVLDWAAGTERAYESGVYVAASVQGWTLAHGRLHLPAGFDAADPRFCDWLRQLSRSLGDVRYFANERVPDYHVWAWARDGEVVRAYCFIGERGEIPLFVGDPTDDEIELAKGTQRGPETGSDEHWAAWFATTPSESDVMAMAGRWSVDPTTIDDAAVTAAGIHGLPPSVRHTSRVGQAVQLSTDDAAADEAAKMHEDAAFWRRFRAGDPPS